MSKRRTWLLLMLVPSGLLLLIPALWVFVSITAKPLHPNPDSIPSVMLSTPSPEWAGAVEHARRAMREGITKQNLPGLSVAAGIDGELVWAEGFGFADLRTSVPVTPKHRFRIGTASTALTSAAAGLLLEDGRFKPEDEIQTWVPAFPKHDWPVTLRELMAHTSGVTSKAGGEAALFTKHCRQTSDMLQHIQGNWLFLERPGTEYRSSIFDWILVSAAIEAASHQPFHTFMRERVLDPLKMSETLPDSGRLQADEDFPLGNMIRELIYDPDATRGAAASSGVPATGGRVTSYFPRFASDPNYGVHVTRPLDYSCYAGAGVFQSTPSDLVRFGMAVLDGTLLRPATTKLLQTSQRLASGSETGYGLGWSVRTVEIAGKPTRVVGHDGDSLGGAVASLVDLPEHRMVIAVTSNISYSDTFSLAIEVAESFLRNRTQQAR